MKGATKTRTQRRMEKKQALLLLVLVLVVSLTSFTLGVVVGRRGAERGFVQQQQQVEKILVAPTPAPLQAPPPKPTVAGTENNVETTAKSEPKDTRLSFYDDLKQQETLPLGSGINLPPVEKKPESTATPPIELPEQPIVKKPLVEQTPVTKAALPEPEAVPQVSSALPRVDPQGKFALQVGSFATPGDAARLQKRLQLKQYPVYVAEADLGTKGLWYRVRLGPYTDADIAKKVQLLVEKQEQMKGFVTRK